MKSSGCWKVAALAFLFFAGLSFLPAASSGGDKVVLYLFWSTGCPHCEKEKVFLDAMERRYPQLDIRYLEVKHNPKNAKLFSEMAEAYGIVLKGVPATFVGEGEPVIGYLSEDTTGLEIESRILQCIERGCADPRGRISNGEQLLIPHGGPAGLTDAGEGICPQNAECPEETPAKDASPAAREPLSLVKEISPPEAPGSAAGGEEEGSVIELPFIGRVDTSKKSLLYQTIAIAGLDGFNPCAFFVLFTLLGLLLHVHSRNRLLLVGGIFVFFSGFVYFIFMSAWLNIFLLTGKIAAVTAAAGAVAFIIAVINIKDFFYFRKGVSLVIPEKAKPRLFDRMRRLVKATSLPSAIFGTVVLSIAANAYELFCTAGFPMVYTRILTLRHLTRAEYYLYLVIYNVIYVVPLAVIVVFFAVTLGARKLTEHQGQILKLISGMMMLCLAVVLLTRPELLNNMAVTAGLLGISLGLSGVIALVTRRVHMGER